MPEGAICLGWSIRETDVREVEMDVPFGERFARAIAAKDAPVLLGLLAPKIDFRAMTPGRIWEADSPAQLVDEVILGKWFEPTDRIDAIEAIENGEVADRESVRYRFRVTNNDGAFLVEQQAYLAVADEGITYLRIMCSGYRPIDNTAD
jgi:hypothetical protein